MLTDDERSMIHRAADALGDEVQHTRAIKAAVAEWARLRALSYLTGGPEAERAAYDRLCVTIAHATAAAEQRGQDAGRAQALATAPEVEAELDSLSDEFAISTYYYDPLKAAIAAHTAREVEQALTASRVATVGVLLTAAPAGTIVEWCDELTWRQVRDGSIRLRNRNNTPTADGWPGPEWSEWCPTTGYLIDDLRLPARLVPVDQADDDPSTRGPVEA